MFRFAQHDKQDIGCSANTIYQRRRPTEPWLQIDSAGI